MIERKTHHKQLETRYLADLRIQTPQLKFFLIDYRKLRKSIIDDFYFKWGYSKIFKFDNTIQVRKIIALQRIKLLIQISMIMIAFFGRFLSAR